MLRKTWREFGAFRSRIAAEPYDRIIDAQGLIRSAMLARLARRDPVALKLAAE